MSRVSGYFLLMFLLFGCAFNQARFETDRRSASYHAGGDRFIPMLGRPFKSYLSEDADKEMESSIVPNSTESAVAGMLLSGLSLALNRNYYDSPFISGRVFCRTHHSDVFDVPCSNIRVVLREIATGKETTIVTSDDEFVFHVEPKKEYQIFAVAKRYRQVTKFSKPLQVGDTVVVYLEPNNRVFD